MFAFAWLSVDWKHDGTAVSRDICSSAVIHYHYLVCSLHFVSVPFRPPLLFISLSSVALLFYGTCIPLLFEYKSFRYSMRYYFYAIYFILLTNYRPVIFPVLILRSVDAVRLPCKWLCAFLCDVLLCAPDDALFCGDVCFDRLIPEVPPPILVWSINLLHWLLVYYSTFSLLSVYDWKAVHIDAFEYGHCHFITMSLLCI